MASSDHLKPKETGKIIATVNTIGKSGNIVKTVQVFSNDPNKPVSTLTVKMTIPPAEGRPNPVPH